MFVFRIGKEAEAARFPVFDLGEAGGFRFGVAFHAAVENAGQFFRAVIQVHFDAVSFETTKIAFSAERANMSLENIVQGFGKAVARIADLLVRQAAHGFGIIQAELALLL